ncbi:trypsin-like peptidase domain protein [Leptospira kirschneri str. 200803703]|uniref:trypsin-like peptidase domain-containing protein n=1 Tax=Leptospira kirschneri TaxID=29507 RepID=UPI000288A65C|nr:trypsin-like peptidase domain-containing protein [Leptospira kirschneri]EMO78115.1 trypsin-like peptidase domain protein [Leptospira kirschneri str. 200801925]EMJ87180.1 trypsin-like peptidase domain protein [Leptospira kirschneri str. JB]EMK13490.1 trypsin-like peptidase domain protein [Leptospira kirschneri serovar Bim str. PUO 1247]EMN04638.1 trypsin-like peptidase domain protein [Leptospira kirschneri serovar Bim str. 1051]EMN24962.1 trypsin-like peptidase domain protein [Leptospira kir
MNLYFFILKLFGVIFYLGFFSFNCSSQIQQIKTAEAEINQEDARQSKDKIRVHHIFEEVYPTSSASSVSVVTEKIMKSKSLSSKGGHFLEKTFVILGYGIVLNQQGYILTNSHVIGTYDHLLVKSKSGKFYEAIVIGQDKKIDLAILQVTPDEDIVPVEKLDYYTLQRGEAAIRKYIHAKNQMKKHRDPKVKVKVHHGSSL